MSISAIFQSQPALASIGNAINARGQRKADEAVGRRSLEQSRQQIAFNEAIRQRQAELLAQEQARQQIMARVAGDAFGSSLGEFQGDFNQRIGDASSQIADFYREFLTRKTQQQILAEQIMPQVSGPAADRQASEMAAASADVMGDAGRMANVQGFGEAMRRAGDVMTGNEQLAALINNFSRGSANAGQAEIDAQAGKYVTRNFQSAGPGVLGDLFVGLGGIAGQYMANRPTPDTGQGLRMGGGEGLRLGGGTGLVSRSNLGIR